MRLDFSEGNAEEKKYLEEELFGKKICWGTIVSLRNSHIS
jgi:hypothetical protein